MFKITNRKIKTRKIWKPKPTTASSTPVSQTAVVQKPMKYQNIPKPIDIEKLKELMLPKVDEEMIKPAKKTKKSKKKKTETTEEK
jgi:hypothetical protein